MKEIEVASLPPDRFAAIVPQACMEEFTGELANTRRRLGARALWHVNSTATGGGVAEMLPPVVGLLRDLGINTEWLVIGSSDPAEFLATVTPFLNDRVWGTLNAMLVIPPALENDPTVGRARKA